MILGMGPAGLTAALYARRSGLTTIVFGDIPGGVLYMLDQLVDFPGFTQGVSGTQFGMLAMQQAQSLGAVFPMVKLEKLCFNEDHFTGVDVDGNPYTAPVAIIATGRSPKSLPAIKADLKGLHFCSVCDGPLYRGRNAVLAVVGGDKVAAQHALTLSPTADQVLLVCRTFTMPSFLDSQLKEHPNINIMRETEVVEIKGEGQVEALMVKTHQNEQREIAVDAVFQAVGWTPNTQMLEMFVETIADGYLKTDERLMTTQPGLFAAGDVRDTDIYGVLTACADGARAAHYAARFINEK